MESFLSRCLRVHGIVWGLGMVIVWGGIFSLATPIDSPLKQMDQDSRRQIENCLTVIRDGQMPNGMIRMRSGSEHVWVVPYFANVAAMGLLAANEIWPSPEDLQRVDRWLNWYAANQEMDGNIYDREGTLERHRSTFHCDATDSYASTHLQVLWRYSRTTQDASIRERFLPSAQRSLGAIETMVDPRDGLTFARKDYPIKYLMDNLEVCMGLQEGAQFFDWAESPEDAQRCRKLQMACQNGLRRFWFEKEGYFAWAIDAFGFPSLTLKEAYPDALANLFAVSYVARPPVKLWNQLKKFQSHSSISMDRWLVGASRVSDAQECTRIKTSLLKQKIQPGEINVDIAGHCIVALTDNATRSPRVDVDWQRPWPRDDAIQPVYNPEGKGFLPLGMGPRMLTNKASAQLNSRDAMVECRFDLKNGYVQLQFPWAHPMDLRGIRGIQYSWETDPDSEILGVLGLIEEDGDIWDFGLDPKQKVNAWELHSAVRNTWSYPGGNGKPEWERMVGYRIQISASKGATIGRVSIGKIVLKR